MSRKKSSRVLAIIGLFIIVLISIYLILFKSDKPFNDYVVKNNNYVNNPTNISDLNAITLVGLDVLNISGVYIMILPMNNTEVTNTGKDIAGYVVGNHPQYTIFVKKGLSRSQKIKIMSHELIHVYQHYKGNIKIYDDYMIWNECNIPYAELIKIPYDTREWEIEAYMYSDTISYRIKETLL